MLFLLNISLRIYGLVYTLEDIKTFLEYGFSWDNLSKGFEEDFGRFSFEVVKSKTPGLSSSENDNFAVKKYKSNIWDQF
jgi:hypothetical protein